MTSSALTHAADRAAAIQAMFGKQNVALSGRERVNTLAFIIDQIWSMLLLRHGFPHDIYKPVTSEGCVSSRREHEACAYSCFH